MCRTPCSAVFEFPEGPNAGVRFLFDATLCNSFDSEYEMYYGTDSAILMQPGNEAPREQGLDVQGGRRRRCSAGKSMRARTPSARNRASRWSPMPANKRP